MVLEPATLHFQKYFLERTKQKSLDGNENNTEIGVIYHARLGNLVAGTNRKKRNDWKRERYTFLCHNIFFSVHQLVFFSTFFLIFSSRCIVSLFFLFFSSLQISFFLPSFIIYIFIAILFTFSIFSLLILSFLGLPIYKWLLSAW